jgi:lysylphosphatidylglycerol synthetase-like protein (DUF2156 family)
VERNPNLLIKIRAKTIRTKISRRIAPTRPVAVTLAIGTALVMSLLNLTAALGHGIGTVASGLERFVRIWSWPGPVMLSLLMGLFLLSLTYELWLRKRAALIILSSVIILQAFFSLVRDRNLLRSALTLAFGILLLVELPEFPGLPDRRSLKQMRIAMPVMTAGFFCYGILGLYAGRSNLGIGGSNIYALAYRSVQIATFKSHLDFDGWMVVYRASLILLGLFVIISMAVLLFRPYREPDDTDDDVLDKARDLVRRYGSDSLAYFNLRRDKAFFFYGQEMFIAYKRVGDVALISADPVGPVELIPDAIRAFKSFCLERGWRMGGVGESAELSTLYEEAGFRTFVLGEESIVDLHGFSLEGRNARKLRQSVSKLERSGITIEFMFNASIPAHVRHELKKISADWRGGHDESGFAMGLGRLLSQEDPDCMLSIAYDREMSPVGFMHWVPLYPDLGYSLDVHRTRIDAPGALSDFLIAKTAMFLREHDYRYMALHFLNLSSHYREDRTEPGSAFWRLVARIMNKFFSLISLYNFDRKFSPQWKKRLMLHESGVDLLLVGLVSGQAESIINATNPSVRNR